MKIPFEPTRHAALSRLKSFVPDAGRAYAARRNYDLGPEHHTAVSRLSPYLRCRILSEEEVVAAVLAEHDMKTAEKFVQEVFWRTYWKGWLELRPGVWNQYQSALARQWDAVQTQSGLRVRWEAACLGKTDIECFNFWAQEIVKTGYMHNHARMWFASIWIFTLELPWELGADFFMRHLLDGDPASNTLSWRWVAGIQTLDKTYLARTSNISKFTDGRFHPKWQLAQHAKPVAAPQKPDPTPLLPSQKPTANLRTGLILHEEDLDPIHVLEGPAPFATAILKPQTNVGPLNSARHVFEFREAAMKDMAARHKDRLGDVSWVEPEDLPSWSEKYNLEQIVTPYAPVGPVATVLDKADLNGISLLKIMRAYDEMAWPQATKGFFPFKKHIPSFVRTLGLQDGTPLLV